MTSEKNTTVPTRVPAAKPFQPAWEQLPQVAEGVVRRAETLLKEVAERVRAGDAADLPQLKHPGFGVTARGLASCNSWLPLNRFEWFKAVAPATDALRIRPPAVTPIDALLDEFCSPLSTVVGADLDGLTRMESNRDKLWTSLADDSSPNQLENLELSLRVSRPGSVPVLRTLPLRSGPDGMETNRKVLVNGAEMDFETAPGQARPPLIIDFTFPQRAVALEFGFISVEPTAPGEDPPSIRDEGVVLIAFDMHGTEIIRSNADAIASRPSIRADTATTVIGVRHAQGEIASVELHFTHPDDAGKVQIVSRIWHEALPPAAVLQGTLVTEGGRGSFAPLTDPNNQLPNPVDRDGLPIPFRLQTILMPFRFNRGIVLLRGFKIETLDRNQREVRRIAVEVNPRLAAGPTRQTPGVFRFERGDSVTLEPRGELLYDTTQPNGYRVHVYYTLVGWDSDQMDAAVVNGEQRLPGLEQDSFVVGDPLNLSDPCAASGGREGCGALFGALQGFDFRMPEDQEIGDLNLSIGASFADSPGASPPPDAGFLPPNFPGTVPSTDIAVPDLLRVRSHLEWSFGSLLSGGDTYSRTIRGAVMTGSSVRLRSLFGNFISQKVGLRPSPATYLPDFSPSLRMVDLVGDLAFIGLSSFHFEVNDAVSAMEIELLGSDYDGQTLRWKVGAGLATEFWVTGVGDPDNLQGFATPHPVFGSLTRRTLVSRTQLLVQDLEFTGWAGLLSRSPSLFGAIRNDGNIPAVISELRISGPQFEYFGITLHLRGEILHAASTIVLRPGETLLVSGLFYPQTVDGTNQTIYTAFVDFQTNVPNQSTLRMNITGRILAQQAEAELLPTILNFGQVPISATSLNMPPHRNVLLLSVGHSPLLIRSIRFENHNIGSGAFPAHPGIFHWRFIDIVPRLNGLYQINPGGALAIQITVTPVAIAIVDTRLIFDTNAGLLELRLMAQVINQNG